MRLSCLSLLAALAAPILLSLALPCRAQEPLSCRESAPADAVAEALLEEVNLVRTRPRDYARLRIGISNSLCEARLTHVCPIGVALDGLELASAPLSCPDSADPFGSMGAR